MTDMEKAKRIGIEAYKNELNEKVEILENLLQNYDDGRRKSFYCLAVNLFDIQDLRMIMTRIESEVSKELGIKDKAKACVRLFEESAELKNILLKLRK